MPTMGGPGLDGLEEHHTRLDLSAEVAAVEQLAFERGEKKLSHIALSKQSPTEPIEGRTPTSQQRISKTIEVLLCVLVGMIDYPGGPPLRQRHVQRFEHQLGTQMSLHRPAHDPAAEGVQQCRETQKTSPGLDINDASPPTTYSILAL